MKFPKLTPERVTLINHPLFLIRLNLKFAYNDLDFIRMDLASGDSRKACEHLRSASGRLCDCEEMIIANYKIVPLNFLEYFYTESATIRDKILFWAHGGIAEEIKSYRQCLKMVITI